VVIICSSVNRVGAISALSKGASSALRGAERLARAVANYDWSVEHARLAKGAVNVDVRERRLALGISRS
jgi:hypothetical protein